MNRSLPAFVTVRKLGAEPRAWGQLT